MAKPKGTATPNGAKPLLDLSTLDKVEFINIDGKRHDVVNLDALTLRPRTRIAEAFMRCLELIVEAGQDSAAKPLTQSKERKLSRAIRNLLPLILPSIAPATVAALNELQRQEIVMAFFVVRSERTGRSTAMERMAAMSQRSTGASSSPGSIGSMAARPNRGTRRSRRRLSART